MHAVALDYCTPTQYFVIQDLRPLGMVPQGEYETRSYSPKEDNGVYLDLGDNEIA